MRKKTKREIKKLTHVIRLGKSEEDDYKVSSLVDEKKKITEQLGLKKSPQIVVIGRNVCDQIESEVIYGKKCEIILVNSEYMIFNLAIAMFKVFLYMTGNNRNLTESEINRMALGYAVAYCEIRGLNTCKEDAGVFIPSDINAYVAASGDKSMYEYENGIPETIREYAERCKQMYGMKVVAKYE